MTLDAESTGRMPKRPAQAEIVLGEDWVRPQGTVDSEVRNHRARRGLSTIFRSPLARKITLFNLIALVALVVGILLTNPFRDSLVQQQQAVMADQAGALAAILGALPDIAGRPATADATPDAAELRRRALAVLALEPRTEVALLGQDGQIEALHHGAPATGTTDADSLPRTPIADTLDFLFAGLERIARRGQTVTPDTRVLLDDLHGRAMAGERPTIALREGGEFRLLAAAPVLEGGQPVGVLVMQQMPQGIEALMRVEREQVLQMFLIILLVSVALSLVLASTIANPLSDLATAAELGRDRNARRMAPGRVRIPDLTGRPDEIGRLSSAMRGMVAALYDRIDANEQFAADVAHEIKNPLASLRSAIGTLRVAKREDQINRLLDVIEHDVRRLDRLISDTSNASRLDAELVKEEEEAFDLRKTLDNLCEHLSQEAASKGIDFIRDLPAEPVVIYGLEARLAQVFVNLITNAISLCGEGDAVRIWARKRKDRVLVVVEDTGPGIPEQALTKIFKRFYSERPQAQFGNHSGLGLAISKQIVEAHHGVIWAENIMPRATAERDALQPLGARFVVGLPL